MTLKPGKNSLEGAPHQSVYGSISKIASGGNSGAILSPNPKGGLSAYQNSGTFSGKLPKGGVHNGKNNPVGK